jgi:hypothetical protein
MKKIIAVLISIIFSVTLSASPVAQVNPFLGEWEAHEAGLDFNIVFMHSNRSIITVRTLQDGVEIVEETYGTWSFDENIIRVSGSFSNSRIQGLNRINWVSVYRFLNLDNSAFRINGTLPNNERTQLTFTRIEAWIE